MTWSNRDNVRLFSIIFLTDSPLCRNVLPIVLHRRCQSSIKAVIALIKSVLNRTLLHHHILGEKKSEDWISQTIEGKCEISHDGFGSQFRLYSIL